MGATDESAARVHLRVLGRTCSCSSPEPSGGIRDIEEHPCPRDCQVGIMEAQVMVENLSPLTFLTAQLEGNIPYHLCLILPPSALACHICAFPSTRAQHPVQQRSMYLGL